MCIGCVWMRWQERHVYFSCFHFLFFSFQFFSRSWCCRRINRGESKRVRKREMERERAAIVIILCVWMIRQTYFLILCYYQTWAFIFNSTLGYEVCVQRWWSYFLPSDFKWLSVTNILSIGGSLKCYKSESINSICTKEDEIITNEIQKLIHLW